MKDYAYSTVPQCLPQLPLPGLHWDYSTTFSLYKGVKISPRDELLVGPL